MRFSARLRTTASLLVLSAGLASVALATMTGEGPGATTASDSRGNTAGLSEGEAPWWPSRYGADDEIGSLNEITPEVTKAAAALVRRGLVVDLGRILDEDTPKFPGRYWHQTLDVTPHYENLRRADSGGQGWGKNQINWITEIQAGTFQVGTQLDSLGHIQAGERFYNGWTTRDLVQSNGLTRFGMETVPPVITRGVLLDVAAYKRRGTPAPRLRDHPGGCRGDAQARGHRAARGRCRAVPHRLGRTLGRRQRAVPERRAGSGARDGAVAVRAAHSHHRRGHLELWPGARRDPERPFLVPQTMYVKLGFFGLENLATEQLAREHVHEFLFVLTHARTRGSTAAVVAPAAVY